jgi:hypothetical protein
MIPLRFLQTWCEQCTCSIINNCADLTGQQKAPPRQHLPSPPGAVSLEGLFFTGCEAPGVWDLSPYIPHSTSYSLVGDLPPPAPPDSLQMWSSPWELPTRVPPECAERVHSPHSYVDITYGLELVVWDTWQLILVICMPHTSPMTQQVM